ncbi:MAG: 50S ribosomal protein L10 [Chloroflexi bacterium]|nr:50S ribosomal protein L10 [Chloroflexota bacterium]
MPSEKKVRQVEELEGLLRGARIAIGTSYAGLTVTQQAEMRRRLRSAGIRYRVVKNSLAAIAARNVGREGFSRILAGPTGLAVSDKDEIATAKAVTEFIRASRLPITITGAVTDGRVLSAPEVETLGTLPPREVLVAQAVGLIQSPLLRLVSVLNGQVQSILVLLQSRAEQLRSQQGGS